jgi:hypothetical protein
METLWAVLKKAVLTAYGNGWQAVLTAYGNGWQAVLPIYGTACATVSYYLWNCALLLGEMVSKEFSHLWKRF